ncbi:hypothetical protein CPB84DRAFT_1749650 [Gymnopilus junonius]|uniref:Uncharacterized protein n=1 Tax=Gymnopilus junonius TaxID=109634 RepID=A0A9P5NJU0_GYMJU|nr:hypothetical protein CPB84DRAFT_1749650 [Gymnopilus junonius]
MQGCGDAVLPMNIAEVSGITSRDPLLMVQHIAKTCIQHFYRNIDELPKNIPWQVVDRLKSFLSISSLKEIDEWRNFCRESEYKEVRNWYANKEVHPWYLPSLNSFLSPMDKESWVMTPDDSNVGESGHAGRHSETSIGCPILLAIQEAREKDTDVVKRLQAFEKNYVSGNHWNSLQSQERKSAARRTSRYEKIQDIDAARKQYRDLEIEIKRLTALKKDSRGQSKVLEACIAAIHVTTPGTPSTRMSAQLRDLEAEMQELKDGPLKTARVHDPRPRQMESPPKEVMLTEHPEAAKDTTPAAVMEPPFSALRTSQAVKDLPDIHELGSDFTYLHHNDSLTPSQARGFEIGSDFTYSHHNDSLTPSQARGFEIGPEDPTTNTPWEIDPECERILDRFLALFPEELYPSRFACT